MWAGHPLEVGWLSASSQFLVAHERHLLPFGATLHTNLSRMIRAPRICEAYTNDYALYQKNRFFSRGAIVVSLKTSPRFNAVPTFSDVKNPTSGKRGQKWGTRFQLVSGPGFLRGAQSAAARKFRAAGQPRRLSPHVRRSGPSPRLPLLLCFCRAGGGVFYVFVEPAEHFVDLLFV